MTKPRDLCSSCGSLLHQTGELAGTCPKCLLGNRPEILHADPEAVQALFPQLDGIEFLGRGGMGVVYQARQPQLDRRVALKLLAPEIAADPDFASRFLREARALARLNHPNIVGVYDFGERDGNYYLIMEFVEGSSLRDLMQQRRMTPAEALTVVPKICAGLQFAHECGIVHRDIKPENILLDQAGQVKIADFGLAKLVDAEPDHLTRVNQVMGTPHYMAPEQFGSPGEVDHRADIYSLGVVFYEMLTQELPVGRFALPSQKVAVDARVDFVVAKALAQEPARRYQHASEVRSDVEGMQVGSPVARSVAAAPEDHGTRLQWVEALGRESALTVASAAILVAAAWFAYLFTVGKLFDTEWIAAAYPISFIAVVAVRGRHFDGDIDSRRVMQGTGLAAAAFAVVLVTSRGWGGEMLLQGMAALLLVTAHMLLDRWIWGGRSHLLIAFIPLLIGATVLHASAGYYNAGREALGFASGLGSLIAAASVASALPEFARSRVSPEVSKGMLRGMAISLPAALIYFREVIF